MNIKIFMAKIEFSMLYLQRSDLKIYSLTFFKFKVESFRQVIKIATHFLCCFPSPICMEEASFDSVSVIMYQPSILQEIDLFVSNLFSSLLGTNPV